VLSLLDSLSLISLFGQFAFLAKKLLIFKEKVFFPVGGCIILINYPSDWKSFE